MDGLINATGTSTDGANDGWRRAGAGGSIQITAETLAGAGSILAAGGNGNGSFTNTRGGGGGRLSVSLTGSGADFGDFTGVVNARAGNAGLGTPLAGVGSIFMSYADQGPGAGLVIFDNFDAYSASANAHYSLLTSEDFSAMDVVVRNRALLELNTDRNLASLFLDDESRLLLSNASTTIVQSLVINSFTYTPGLYDATDLGSQVTGDGFISVIPEPAAVYTGLVIMLAAFFVKRRLKLRPSGSNL